jgi:vancomycin permeability regulator SanA
MNLPEDVKSFVFISQDFHLSRILMMAKKRFGNEKDLYAHASFYEKGRLTKEPYFFLREVAGAFYFFFMGFQEV